MAASPLCCKPISGALVDVEALEALPRTPAALDGSAGLNRAPVPSRHADRATNLQAVHPWIAICSARSEAPSRLPARSRTAPAVGDRP
ncbi:hypothetical protein KDW62_28785 [Burkholderia multivorans]|uniref:hypothetical protein n=1 Tax=Burkholderia multivorans TaxID=87883 RepID=UPI001B9AF7BE|nr:hypothetical protein [Burkholderia multivorans]MBR8049155.1 hypothetical protein [Burkholderia multivorans]